jgi:ABC-2 type transport system ATP-binding protein
MSKESLKQYIEAARKVGMTNEQITQELVTAGWQVHDLVDLVLTPKLSVPQEAAKAVISVRNVSKLYGPKIKALDNVSLDIAKGGVTALLGPNGAGKTTLVRILATLLAPSSGKATVADLDVVKDAQTLRSVIGLAGQYAAVDDALTGRENLEMFGRLYHIGVKPSKDRATELLQQFDLVEAADRTLKTYSGGMRRRLDLAASLVIKPKVLFLDEPTTGLDPRSRFALWNVIRDLTASGTTVLLTTQYMEEADQLANYIFVIDHGHIITQGTPEQLKRQIGGDILELHLVNHQEATSAAKLLKGIGKDEPHVDETSGIVTLPVEGGATILVDVVRKFDAANVKLKDIMLRRASLDDVFLKLTGHGTE